VIQMPLIKELICYVCGRGVTEKDSVRIGGGLRRHRKCKPVAKRQKDRRSGTVTQSAKQDAAAETPEDSLFP
jgi:hypothetical protein